LVAVVVATMVVAEPTEVQVVVADDHQQQELERLVKATMAVLETELVIVAVEAAALEQWDKQELRMATVEMVALEQLTLEQHTQEAAVVVFM
jgi:hypothetical protein